MDELRRTEFNSDYVDLSMVEPGLMYYDGFVFVPSTAIKAFPFFLKDRPSQADAAHCTGPAKRALYNEVILDANHGPRLAIQAHQINDEQLRN